MSQSTSQNMPTNQPTADTFEVGNVEGKESEADVSMETIPTTLPAKNVKIGNVKGDNSKTSTVIGTGKSKRLNSVWLIGGIILTAVNSIAANILSTYIQEKYGILTQTSRLAIVAFVFVVTLLFASWLAIRNSK